MKTSATENTEENEVPGTDGQNHARRRNKILAGDAAVVPRKMYDIGDWLSWGHEKKGHANISFSITTATGKYLLRQSNPRKSLEELRFETSLIDFLRAGGYPAPEIIPALNGEKFVEYKGAFYLLSRFIEGSSYDAGNPRHLIEAGRGLGRFHALVRKFPGPFYRRSAPMMSLLGSEDVGSFSAIERFGSRFLGHSEQKRLTDMLSYLRDKAEAVRSELADIYPGMPKLVVHASYDETALIFKGDTLAGVVDYDRATYDIRAMDLACSIKNLCHSHGEYRAKRQVELDYGCCRNFLDAYREVEPLDEEEIRSLPLICRARHLLKIINKCIGFLQKDAVEARTERHMKRLIFMVERETAWFDWFERHGQELITQGFRK